MPKSYSYTVEYKMRPKPGDLFPREWTEFRSPKTLERAVEIYNEYKDNEFFQNLRIVQHIEHSIRRTWVGKYTEHKVKKVLHEDPGMVLRWTEK